MTHKGTRRSTRALFFFCVPALGVHSSPEKGLKSRGAQTDKGFVLLGGGGSRE